MRNLFILRGRDRAGALALVAMTAGWLGAPPALRAAMPLIDFEQLGSQSQISINGPTDVATQMVDGPSGKALEVRCTPGDNANPGVVIRPGASLKWNLSAFGEVEADVVNLSDTPLVIQLRVDNPGDNHETRGNSDKLTLPSGKRGIVRVYFGYSMGKPAYALDATKISQLILFTSKPSHGDATFRVSAIRAAGKPGDKPPGMIDTAAAKPSADGVLVPLDGTLLEAQIEAQNAKLALPAAGKPGPATLTFPPTAASKEAAVIFKTPGGMLLDLSDYTAVDFTVKNTGTKPVRFYCRINGAPGGDGKMPMAVAECNLDPGATKTRSVPLTAATDAAGLKFAQERVISFGIATELDGAEKSLELVSLKASGQKPPANRMLAAPSAAPSAAASPSSSPAGSPAKSSPSPSPNLPSPKAAASASPAASNSAAASGSSERRSMAAAAMAAQMAPKASPTPSPTPSPSASVSPSPSAKK